MSTYAVTGASGRLGQLVVDILLTKVAPSQVVALTRTPAKLADLASKGVIVRAFDFENVSTLHTSLTGVNRLLLISGSEIGQRARQHRAAIQAAKEVGVTFIAYTSVLHADTCTLGLAAEHRETEADIKASGLEYALLRHGWYTENTTLNAANEVARGTVIGSTGTGRQSTATRIDFALADAAVLLDHSVASGVFELAGDHGYTLDEYAATLSEVSGTSVTYVNMPEAKYREALVENGMPGHVASLLSHASATSADSVMLDESGTLSRLIGRPATSLRASVVEALSGNGLKDSTIFH